MTQDETQQQQQQQQRNTEAGWSAFMYVGIAFAIAAAFVGAIIFGGQAMTRAHEEGTKRIAECVEAGGSWINTTQLCINDGNEE
jgi:p-aminobenzoyl-glutamate transporter AbgT